jgi:hypothetical protein
MGALVQAPTFDQAGSVVRHSVITPLDVFVPGEQDEAERLAQEEVTIIGQAVIVSPEAFMGAVAHVPTLTVDVTAAGHVTVSPFASSACAVQLPAFTDPVSVEGHLTVGPPTGSDGLQEPAFCAPLSVAMRQL